MSFGYTHKTTDFAPRNFSRLRRPSWVSATIGGNFSPTLTAICVSCLSPGWNQRPDFEDLVADGDRFRLAADRYERRPQHATANIVVPDVDLAFVEPAATHGKGFALEVFPQ